PFLAKDRTITNADGHVFRHHPARKDGQQAAPGLHVVAALANALGADVPYAASDDVTNAIAAQVEGYPTAATLGANPATTRVVGTPSRAAKQEVAGSPAASASDIQLITGRSLYHSWEGSSMRSEEADKLHREEAVWLNPADAAVAGVRDAEMIE